MSLALAAHRYKQRTIRDELAHDSWMPMAHIATTFGLKGPEGREGPTVYVLILCVLF